MYPKKHFFNPKRTDLIFGLLLFILSAIVLWSFFKNILSHPSHFLFGAGGDAIKNYYTTIYYVLFDKGSHFSGLNYPYGENVVFTDNQPLLAFLANLFHHNAGSLEGNIIGIMNLAMLLSIIIGAFFLYLILRRNLLPGWYAIPAAILIAFLSPQHSRLGAHYALAYVFIIPLQWYLLIRIFDNRRSYLWYILYFFSSLFIGFLHPYFLLLGNTIFLLSYIFVYALQEIKNIKKHALFLVALLALSVLPIIVFQLWLKFSAPITDRPSAPFGFLVYRSTFESVFFPVVTPFREFWIEAFKTKEAEWEGHAYVGLMGLTCLLLTIILAVRYLIRFRIKLIFRPALPQPLRIGIWAATLVLLFSMGIPFIYGLESLADLVPPLKQFRSIGRFAWVFYYVFSVYTAFYFFRLYRYLSVRNSRGFAYSFLAFILVIWALDVKLHLTPKARELRKNESANHFMDSDNSYSNLLAGANKFGADFQAIIPLPYYNIGSEYFALHGSGNSMYESFKASLNLGLPISANLMSRTSVSQSASLIQFFSNDLIRKELAFKLPSTKPFLLIVKKEGLQPYEQRLVNKARKLAENNHLILYELPVAALQADSVQAQAAYFKANKEKLYKSGAVYASKPVTGIEINSFSGAPAEGLFDAGALTADGKPATIFNGKIKGQQDTATFEASVWFYADHTTLSGVFNYKQFDANGGLVEAKDLPIKFTTDIYKNWARATITFQLKHPDNRIEIYTEGGKPRLDNFLLRPKNTDIYHYSADNKKLLKNNFLLE